MPVLNQPITEISANIAEYMSSMSIEKEFTAEEVVAIRSSMYREFLERKKNGNQRIRTKADKLALNKRIAKMANEILNSNKITHEDVRLFKRCRADEYTDRTGKCAWGFKDVIERQGFDPETRLELQLA